MEPSETHYGKSGDIHIACQAGHACSLPGELHLFTALPEG